MNQFTEYRVELLHIGKSFNGVKALKDVSLLAKPGEIHALLGENGAGKSTLMKVLSGAHQKDQGIIKMDGKEVSIRSPEDSKRLGIGIIYQEFSLIPDLSVADNIYLSHLTTGGMWIRQRKLNRQAEALLSSLGFALDPRTQVGHLSVAHQQVVEIAKALSKDVSVLILDEPTAVLAPQETGKLFAILNTLKQKGVTIIYISHRLEEIFNLCDRITVIKDGASVKTVDTKDITQDALIRLMIGRNVESLFEERKTVLGDEVLRVENLSNAHLHNVSFSMRAGEVLGISGLVGSGRTELLQAIFGADPKSAESRVFVSGKRVVTPNPVAGVGAGMGLVPEDRKRKGLILPMSIRENITIANLTSVSDRLGFIRRKREKTLSDTLIERLVIRTLHPDNPVVNLSGGNQQKVAFAKWLTRRGKLILIDEPTRGVDVGAKTEIYKIINALTREGYGVLVVSSEMIEIMGISDRILVMRNGTIQGEVQKADFSEETLLRISIGQSALAN
jgi:ribose transport system ATP-binding protein